MTDQELEQTKYQTHNWSAIIEQWRSSGLSKSAFCKQKGFATSSFYTALNRRSGKPTSLKSKSFVKAKVIEPSQSGCTVEFPNKIKVKVARLDLALIKSLAGLSC